MAAVLAHIAHLYKVEKRAQRSGIAGEDLRSLREHAAKPVLEKLHDYLEKFREEALPKSEAGQAVAYTLKNWTALMRYLEDGTCPSTTTTPSGACSESRWDAAIGPS